MTSVPPPRSLDRAWLLQADAFGPEAIQLGGFTCHAWTARHPTREEGPNQDAALALDLMDAGALFAVADGAGGYAHGADASREALACIARVAMATEGSPRERVLAGVEEAHRLLDEGAGQGATTLALVHVHAEGLRCYHVGDSRILLFGQRGKRKFETVAHSPVGYGVEAGLIQEDEALHHEDRHYVSNLLGAGEYRIEMSGRLDMARRDTLVLATDGLFANVTPDDVIEIARKGPADRAIATLGAAAGAGMAEEVPDARRNPDDATVLLVRRHG